MKYFDLLHLKQGQYFNTFLQYFNSSYSTDGQYREYHYGRLIKRYYKLNQGTINNPSVSANHINRLIDDNNHINDIYKALQEFGYGKRATERIQFDQFQDSIRKHRNLIAGLEGWTMHCIHPDQVPQRLIDDLTLLYHGLEVVPSGKPKLVWVSKTLHFLLPSLIMPVDGENVLGFLGEKMPQNEAKRFELFKEVFVKYTGLAAQLELKVNNGDGNWWNISVPKRIDNAIDGFWKIFNKENRESIMCNHIDMLLSFLRIPCALALTQL
jgi:hypothetical protein